MTQSAILGPVFGMVILTISVWVGMYVTRLSYMKTHRIAPQSIKDRQSAAERLREVSAPASNFANLLEVPVLFYLLAVLLLVLEQVDAVYVTSAWVYVGLRVAHSAIHLTENVVVYRFAAYAASCIILWLMWLRLAASLLFS